MTSQNKSDEYCDLSYKGESLFIFYSYKLQFRNVAEQIFSF